MCPKRVCISTVGVRKDLFKRNPFQVPITDFFGSVRPVELMTNVSLVPLVEAELEKVEKKPLKRYKYAPQLVNFNTLL